MQKKILILCEAFAPPAYLPRIINLCKNLNKNNWEPHIFAEKINSVNYNTNICELKQMIYYKYNNKIYWLFKWLLHFIFQYKDYKFIKFIEKSTNINDYSIIMCSVSNIFPLTSATKLSKKYNKPLLIDLRDIDEQWEQYEYFTHNIFTLGKINKYIYKYIEKINIKRRNFAIKNANIITTISPWHKDLISSINQNTFLIYNGYDKNCFFNKNIKTPYFNIVYAGRLINLNFRNPDILFKAIKQLDDEKKITPQQIKINWYLDNKGKVILYNILNQYELKSYNIINEFVPTSKIPDILNSASINLILTTKSNVNGPHGIMTTKFFEALGVEKPILCIKSDEECLAKVIKDTECGLAATNVNEVKEFILKYYNQWKDQGYTHINVKNKEQFTRQNQALQFEELFNTLI